MPSAFSITLGDLPSMTATHELVVPRSMPMTLLMVISSQFAAGRPGRLAPEWDARGSSADPPDPAPWILVLPQFCGSMPHIGGPPGAASQVVTNSRATGLGTRLGLLGHCRRGQGRVRQAGPSAIWKETRTHAPSI